MLLQRLEKQRLIHPPGFLTDNVMYLTVMGSQAYGVSTDMSDMDIYGFCIPPKDDVFPHLRGEIPGFGRNKNRFEQWQEQHVCDESTEREYDFTVYSIVKYFSLCMENNPNMVDSLFTPANMVIHQTAVGQMVREKRHIFLHKGCWHKFKGYAYSQASKMGRDDARGKRKDLVDKYGYDVKFAYHVVRLMDEVEQILATGDLDLQRAKEQLRAIREGAWTQERVMQYFQSKEVELEALYTSSTLPHGPREGEIKQLLLDCLEHHYGSLSQAIVLPGAERRALEDIIETAKRGLGWGE